MNKQWNKDGLTRKKLENDFRIHEPFQVLEKNLSNLLARAMKSKNKEAPYFVPGRKAMTCCADDMTFLGYICKSRDARHLETRQWVTVRARVEVEFWKDYDGEGPVLYAEEVVPAEPIEEVVQFG